MKLSNIPESSAPIRDATIPNGVRVDTYIGTDTTIIAVDLGPPITEPGQRSVAPGASGPSPGPGQHAT